MCPVSPVPTAYSLRELCLVQVQAVGSLVLRTGWDRSGVRKIYIHSEGGESRYTAAEGCSETGQSPGSRFRSRSCPADVCALRGNKEQVGRLADRAGGMQDIACSSTYKLPWWRTDDIGEIPDKAIRRGQWTAKRYRTSRFSHPFPSLRYRTGAVRRAAGHPGTCCCYCYRNQIRPAVSAGARAGT